MNKPSRTLARFGTGALCSIPSGACCCAMISLLLTAASLARASTNVVFRDTFDNGAAGLASRQDDAGAGYGSDIQWRPRIGSQIGCYSVLNDSVLGPALRFSSTANYLWIIGQFDNDCSDGVTFGSGSVPVTLGPAPGDALIFSTRVRMSAAVASGTGFNCGITYVPPGPISADPGTDNTWVDPCTGYFMQIPYAIPGMVRTGKQFGSPSSTPYSLSGTSQTANEISPGISGVNAAIGADTGAHAIRMQITRLSSSSIQIDSYFDGVLASTATDDTAPYTQFNSVMILYTKVADYFLDDVQLLTVSEGSGYWPPVTVDDTYALSQNATLTVAAPGVLANDRAWTTVPPLTATKLSDPTNGSLTYFGANGAFAYVPNANFSGTDAFDYSITDLSNNTATATVTLVVNDPADRAFISLRPFCARADGTQSCVAVVKVFDGSGAPAAGQVITLVSSRGSADVIRPSNPRTTDANGEASFTICSSTPGSSTITANWSGGTIRRGIIEEGAVGLWSFEGDAKDSSGFNNHGSLQNGPSFVPGRSGQAIALNGLNQYVNVPHDNSLNNRQAWSIDAWIYVDSIPTNKAVILQKSSGSDGDFYLSCSNRLFRARCATRGGADDVDKYAIETPSGLLSAGRWTHVVAVWAGDVPDRVWDDGSLRIFVDGAEKRSWDIARYLCRNQTQPLNIGRDPAGNEYFAGALDEVKLYNRALWPPEIQRSFEFATTVHFTLTPPTGVTARPADPESIQLSWTRSSNTNITTYKIYRSTNSPVAVSSANLIDEVPYFVTVHRDYKVSYGVPYYYVVTACSCSNESVASSQVVATPVKAPTNPRWYGGDTHVHSVNSWDVYYHPPTELANGAKAAGFDFLFLTDHDSIVGRHEMHTNSTATFLAMQGEEVSLSSGGDNDHFNAFFIDEYVPGTGAEVDLHDQVRNQGGLAMPNHCGYYTETTNIDGLEIIHGATAKTDTVNAWDWYLKQGYKLMGRGSTDKHGDYGKITTLVWMERLCYRELYEAFKRGRAIAVTGPGIQCMLKVNGAMIGDTLNLPQGQPLRVEITANSDANISSIELVKHGAVVWSSAPNTKGATNVYNDISGTTNTYYRLHLQDAAGKQAFSGAIYLRYQPAATLTINASADEGGFISPSGTVQVLSGSSTNFHVWSQPDYRISGLRTNGVEVGLSLGNDSTDCIWTWANVAASGTIAASFVPRLTPHGIPFTWLAAHEIAGRDPSVESEDPDNDGFTNLEEFAADTDPSNSGSKVPSLQVRRDPQGTPELYVETTSATRVYCLLSTANLLSAPEWSTHRCMPGNGGNLVFTVTNTEASHFYRLQISP